MDGYVLFIKIQYIFKLPTNQKQGKKKHRHKVFTRYDEEGGLKVCGKYEINKMSLPIGMIFLCPRAAMSSKNSEDNSTVLQKIYKLLVKIIAT